MSYRAWILKDLVIVAALVCLVAKEVDLRVLNARDIIFIGQVLQAVGLVPAGGEDVEGDLSADGESDWEERGLLGFHGRSRGAAGEKGGREEGRR